MRRNPRLFVAVISLVSLSFAGGYFASVAQTRGQVKPLAVHSNGTDITLVLSRLDGVLRGRDVSFLYRHDGERWYGYYLAHESGPWRNVTLQSTEGHIEVRKDEDLVAVFNLETRTFRHILQGITYSRDDGIEGGTRSPKWGLENPSGVSRKYAPPLSSAVLAYGGTDVRDW